MHEPDDPLALLAQTVHTRWRVDACLGTGGMGSVYKAYDTHTEEHIALKVLCTEDTNLRNRFLQECFILHTLSHPNIVRFKNSGYCRIHDILFLAIEYVEMPTIDLLLQEETPLNLYTVLQTLLSVLSALDTVHRAKIIHRDLKPSNICADLHTNNIKIFDFGIAKINTLDLASITLTGQICGTPCYIAPEQIRQHPLSPKTDLYAFGVLLYRILAGRVPFYDSNIAALCNKHLNDTPPDLYTHWNPTSSPHPALIKLTLDLLQKNPLDRPRDAREVFERMHSAISHPDFPHDAFLSSTRTDISQDITRSNTVSTSETTLHLKPL